MPAEGSGAGVAGRGRCREGAFEQGKAAKVAKASKTAKAANPKPAAKASKVAKKPAGDTKAAIAYRMLTSAKGTTRAAIVEACDGWGIDVKQFCARKGLKLWNGADGTLFAAAKGRKGFFTFI